MASDEEMSDDQLRPQDSIDEQSECKFIAEGVKRYPEILEKSQIPVKKAKKQTAIEKVITEYRKLFGKEITSKGLLKKVRNMKTRLKKKTDKTKTGNKRIRSLLTWEKIMMEAMNADVNPTVAEIPDGLEVGTQAPSQFERDVTTQITLKAAVKTDKRKLTTTGDEAMVHETEETRKLTSGQLQCLVMLEKLKAARLQQEYLSIKLKARARPDTLDGEFFQENGKTLKKL